MLLLPFLNLRQTGTKSNCGLRAFDYQLNLDNVLSRLTCTRKDVYTIHGEYSEVPPFACKFRKDKEFDLLAIATEDGDIMLFNTTDGLAEPFISSFTAHNNAVFDICWLPDKCQILTASGDHHACLWDIGSNRFTCISSFRKHTASVKSVDVCNTQSAVFATGSRDGNINIWDIREKSGSSNKCAISINNAHSRKNSLIVSSGKKHSVPSSKEVISSVSSVAFQDCHNLASAGVADGVIKIWDLRKTYINHHKFSPMPRYQMNYSASNSVGHGCTSLVFDSQYKKLYACSTGSKIYQYDCHSYSNDAVVFEGFRCATYFVKLALSCDDQYLLCGSSDEKAYIWKTTKPGLPIFELPGHLAEVTSVTWSPCDVTKLVTCSDDNKVFVWKTGSLESDKNNEVLSSCSLYTGGSNHTSIVSPSDISSKTNSLKRLSSLSSEKKTAMRVITNFFSPITLPCTRTLNNSYHYEENILNENELPHNIQNNVPSPIIPQILTPCKIVNKDNIIYQTPVKDIQASQIISEAENASSSLGSSSQDKENNKRNVSCISTNVLGQTKRKLTLKQSTPKLRRVQTHNCNKIKNRSKNEKKLKSVSGRTIMNYFTVDLSP